MNQEPKAMDDPEIEAIRSRMNHDRAMHPNYFDSQDHRDLSRLLAKLDQAGKLVEAMEMKQVCGKQLPDPSAKCTREREHSGICGVHWPTHEALLAFRAPTPPENKP